MKEGKSGQCIHIDTFLYAKSLFMETFLRKKRYMTVYVSRLAYFTWIGFFTQRRQDAKITKKKWRKDFPLACKKMILLRKLY